MTVKKINLCTIFLFGSGLIGIQAQGIHETVPAAGGNASGSGGSVSYSVGQVVYTTNTGANGSVAEGVQQPFEISVVTEIDGSAGISLMVTAYPNPVTDILTLSVNNYKTSGLSYQLYDMNGNLLETKEIKDNKTNIATGSLVTAVYFLKVTNGKKEVKTFQIIKN